ncbi:S-type anion channel SLAH2-like [Macadamia integrifolia]|uniref:S-type anion channel SLAH2-like n=1 Tax=Macadamia integrifolia TaxID=60698 RepID=UPI001C52D3D0|nr:S-type anion channel SLAH2-like [Macadamia integrifolia]XP_042478179.1 S-type anion channel SLAH2-like [Macadamia integrifolia]XP_042478180.1 S-type anion channel SLAH2-like [Macadamia integrifolia]
MENGTHLASAEQDSAEELPSLFKCLASKTVAGFDNIEESGSPNPQVQRTGIPTSSPSLDHVVTKRTQATACQSPLYASAAFNSKEIHSISTSMLPSPFGHHLGSTKRVLFRDREGASVNNGIVEPPAMAVGTEQLKQEKYHSQPLQSSSPNVEAVSTGKFSNFSGQQGKNPRIDKLNGRNYDSFKTWSGKLERQITHFRGKPTKPKPDDSAKNPENQALPVDRYFDALEGPELDMLRDSEESVLPEDKKWPFLLRYPISSFGICLGVSSQAILWKSLATSASTKFLHISLTVNLFLWCISVVLISIVFFIYLLKVILYFEAVRREYYHPIRVNFFFAPWIALLFLALGVPPTLVKDLHAFLWYILMIPIFCLGLKIYGQWMSGGQRRLSKVANPSNHLAIVGNFVGALLGASMGLKEGPIFFFAIGLAHYVVLFVTLYQRLPTNETLPKELHPVFFLFVAAPSVASMAWARIQGAFDYGSRLAYFIALFLYFSLAVRINFFRGFKFSIAWWAYTFPMTGASIATIRYSNEVTNLVTQSLSVILSGVSTFTVTALLISTVIHAFVLRDLFPNDIAIAITGRRPKIGKKWGHRRSESQDAKDNKSDMKLRKDCKDIEASPKPSVSTGIDVSCQVTTQKV